MLYLDTSAFLKLYVREEGSETVQRRVEGQDDPLPVWEVQEMELVNALRLKVHWKEISPEKAEEQIELFNKRKARGQYYTPEIQRAALMSAYRELSTVTPELGCCTMDILHVACARQLGPEHFLTFDRRQEALAIRAGLSVPKMNS